MKKFFNAYTILICIQLLFQFLCFNMTKDFSFSFVGKITTKIESQYRDYFEYKNDNKDKSKGQIYVSYNKLNPVEMIAIDVLVDKKINDSDYAYVYVKEYFNTNKIAYDDRTLSEFVGKVNDEMNSIVIQYKYTLIFYQAMPYIFNAILNSIAIVILVWLYKRRKD